MRGVGKYAIGEMVEIGGEGSRIKSATATDEMGPSGRLAECLCSCGKIFKSPVQYVRIGKARSCGCLHIDMKKTTMMTHGQTYSRTYISWGKMKERCTNPKMPSYARYGGRGITICDRWMNSFEAFLADMGERPEGMSLDRIDNAGNYEPGNCRWANASTQNNNTRRNIYMTHDGQTRTLPEWSALTGLSQSTLRVRYIRLGWSASRALTTPRRVQKN